MTWPQPWMQGALTTALSNQYIVSKKLEVCCIYAWQACYRRRLSRGTTLLAMSAAAESSGTTLSCSIGACTLAHTLAALRFGPHGGRVKPSRAAWRRHEDWECFRSMYKAQAKVPQDYMVEGPTCALNCTGQALVKEIPERLHMGLYARHCSAQAFEKGTTSNSDQGMCSTGSW